MLSTMRRTRRIAHCRCYHLISRLYPPAVRLLAKRGAMRGAHRAFFLDDEEKTRRGYAFMYGNADYWDVIRDSHEKSMREAMSEILAARESERAEREAKGEPAPGRRANPPPSKADPGLDAPRRFALELERGDPAVVVVVPRGGVLREGRLRLRPHRPRYAGLPCGRLETCRQAMAMLPLRHFHDACLLMAIGEAWKYGVLPAATRSGPCASRWLSLRLWLRR